MYSADSHGRLMPETEFVLIFDLDSTLLSVNSFPYWVRYLLYGTFGGLSACERMLLTIRTAKIMLERKLSGKTHYTAKRQLQALWSNALKTDNDHVALDNFCKVLGNYIRPNLAGIMKLAQENNIDSVLATAAAGEYAINFSRMLGFKHIITTPAYTGAIAKENSGEEKRDRVLALLAAEGFDKRRRVFFTDHEEDLPLIRQSQLVLWFGDDSKIEAIRQYAPETGIIAASKFSAYEIMKLF